jgi:WD40 repeat protein
MAGRLTPFESSPRAFISYARADGADVARALRSRLEAEHPEVTLWLDRERMVGGVGWWKQITEALDQVEILIMVLTPGAVKSDVAAKEWRYARQQGVRVCPVFNPQLPPDFAALPLWMRKAHCYDLNQEWATFIAYLQSAGRDTRVPFMAPDLPEGYVARPAERGALLSSLLDETGESPRAVTVAFHGPGGVGKTSLACSVCHAENVISAFDDGILWARLGEKPNLQGELTKLYAALTGERPPFVDVDDAAIQLAEKLDQKTCLLVIDDVWSANDLRPFLRGGKGCARLVTTRQLDVLSEAGAERTSVGKMTTEQAVELLGSRIEVSQADTPSLRSLGRRLGEWPLVLKLAGSQLAARMARGDSLAGAVTYVNRALDKRGIVALDRPNTGERADALASTIRASLELLPEADRDRCAQLAVFRGDEILPLGALSVLWGLDAFETEDLVLRLDNAALLEFDLKNGSVRVHAVLRAYFASMLQDVKALHAQLAGAWLEKSHDLPDPYAWTWIGWHLVEAAQPQRLAELLLDFNWLRTRIAHVPVQDVLQDFALLEDTFELRTLRDALRLALPGLAFDPGQLPEQLKGRIVPGQSPALDRLLNDAGAGAPGRRLALADASLIRPGGALLGTLKSHTGAVLSLAISPDGRELLSASEDWTLRLWSLETSAITRVFEGHLGIVRDLAFAAGGRTILSVSDDRTLRVWDAETRTSRVFRGHTLAVQGVAVTPDGGVAATVSEDGSVRLWNLAKETSKAIYRGRDHQLIAVALTPDGGKVVFGAGDWTLRAIDVATGKETVFQGHGGTVRALAISPDGSRVISGADDGSVRIWSLETGEPLATMTGHAGAVDAIAIEPEGRKAFSGGRDKSLRVWDLDANGQAGVFAGHAGYVTSVVISPATRQPISGSTDGTIRLWNVDHADQARAAAHSTAVSLLAMTADGSIVVSGGQAGDPVVWEAGAASASGDAGTGPRTAPRIAGALSGHRHGVNAVQITAGGTRAVTCSRDRDLRVWDLATRSATSVLGGHSAEVLDVDISADGLTCASFSRDRTLRAWSVAEGRCTRVLVSLENARMLSALRDPDPLLAEVSALPAVDVFSKRIPKDITFALSPSGEVVVFGFDSTLCVWNVQTGIVTDHEMPDFGLVAAAYNADSSAVLLGSLFGRLALWRFGGPMVMMDGHSSRILNVAMTADGRSAVSAARDGSFCVWDLGSGGLARQFQGSVDKPDAVAIAADTGMAFTVAGDTLVAIDTTTGKPQSSLTLDHQITTIALTLTGARLVVGDQSGGVHFLSLM